MKVLLLMDDFLPGGISRHVSDVANALLPTDIMPYVSATPGKFLLKLHKDIPFLPLNLLIEDSFNKNIFGFFSSYNRLVSFIKKNNIDIIHSHKRYSHAIGKLLCAQFRIPHITSYHTDFEGKKYLSVFGDYTICCSDFVRELVINQFGCKREKSMTVHHGILPFRRQSEDEKRKTLNILGTVQGERIISSVGQFIPLKGKKSLILAINELKKRKDISNVRFVLLGYGEQKQYLENLVKQLSLKDIILFSDGLFDTESLFNVSEFMILNSIREGFGIVMLEAASLGKVHIGTNVGGIPEFIENGKTGILVEKENPVQLANAIESLLDDPQKRKKMEECARIKFESKFTLDRMTNHISDVYRNVYSTFYLNNKNK